MALLSQNDYLQRALEDFYERLNARVPLELADCCQFVYECDIKMIATQEKAQVLMDYEVNLKALNNSDRDANINGDILQLGYRIQDVIDKFISKHKSYMEEAESLMQTRRQGVCRKIKIYLEEQLAENPGMEPKSAEEFLTRKILRDIDEFQKWMSKNLTFYYAQERKLRQEVSLVYEELMDQVKIPLIYRLASDNITIGTRISKQSERLHTVSIPSLLAVDYNGRLVCGYEALKCPEHWSLQDLILEKIGTERKEISFKIPGGGEWTTRTLSLELFLGLIFKTLKKSAEVNLKRTFHNARIIIPVWFCSSQRVQIKNAAKIAGFSKPRLVNQEVLAAYAYDTRRVLKKPKTKVDILVMVENFGFISAIMYCKDTSFSYVRSRPTGHYDSWKPRLSFVDQQYHSSELQRMSSRGTYRCNRPSYLKDFEARMRRMNILMSLSAFFRGQSVRSCNVEETVLFVTESAEWMQTFAEFKKTFGYGNDNSANGVLSASEMFGGSLMCEKDMDHCLQGAFYRNGQIPCRLFSAPESSTSTVNPNQLVHELPLRALGMSTDIQIEVFQEFNPTKELRPLGKVEFVGKYSKEYIRKATLNNKLCLTFEIDFESVLTFQNASVEIMLKSKAFNDGKVVQPQDFDWKPSNASSEDYMKELKVIVDSSLQ